MPHWTFCTYEVTSGGVGSCVIASLPEISSATTPTTGIPRTTPVDVGSCVTTSFFSGSPMETLVPDCEDVGSYGTTSS